MRAGKFSCLPDLEAACSKDSTSLREDVQTGILRTPALLSFYTWKQKHIQNALQHKIAIHTVTPHSKLTLQNAFLDAGLKHP